MGWAARANGLRRERCRRWHGNNNTVLAGRGEPEIDAREEVVHLPSEKSLTDTVAATPVMTRPGSVLAALVGRTIAAATAAVV